MTLNFSNGCVRHIHSPNITLSNMIEKTVYLVKFPAGYYAKKQPNVTWTFTENLHEANQYSLEKTAIERGQLGASLHGLMGTENAYTYVVECFVETTELKKKETK